MDSILIVVQSVPTYHALHSHYERVLSKTHIDHSGLIELTLEHWDELHAERMALQTPQLLAEALVHRYARRIKTVQQYLQLTQSLAYLLEAGHEQIMDYLQRLYIDIERRKIADIKLRRYLSEHAYLLQINFCHESFGHSTAETN